MMGAVVNIPTLSNPFRFNLGTSSSDAFIVGITGAGKPVPSSSNELEEVHRLERIQKIKDLEHLNAEDGNAYAVVQLKQLRHDLEEGLELISPEVNHADIEQWALGQ